jgi:uncharacterized protein (DUF58 family)
MERFLSKRLVLLALAAILFLTAWNRGIPLLYLMFSLLLATVLLGQLLPYLALGRIEVERTAPGVAVVGDPVALGFSLRNLGLLPRFMVEVSDRFPCGDYGRTEPLLFVPYLAAGGAIRQELRVACAVRGEFTLGPLQLASAFPLGIARRRRQLSKGCLQLLVYPETFPIAGLAITPSSTSHREAGESISIAGGSEEFFGIREYRAGDSIRKVHWPSSARRNQLVVKEMEMRVSAQVTLLLDLYEPAHAGRGAEHSLEYAVKIAASLCRHILERQHQACLIGHGERLHVSPCRVGQEHLRELLTMLAKVKTGVVPFARLLQNAEARMRDGQSVFLVCSGRSLAPLEMRQALALLKAKRMQVVVVLVETAGFGGKDHPDLHRELSASGVRFHRMGKGDFFTALFQPGSSTSRNLADA